MARVEVRDEEERRSCRERVARWGEMVAAVGDEPYVQAGRPAQDHPLVVYFRGYCRQKLGESAADLIEFDESEFVEALFQ